MKVLYIGSDAQMCGAGLSMIRLIEEEIEARIDVVPVFRKGVSQSLFAEKGLDYYIVNAQSWVISKKYNKIKSKCICLVKTLLNIKCYYQYIKIIKKENPDIVHINSLTTYVGAKAAIKMNKKVVWHIRELIDLDLNGKFFNPKKAYELMNKADAFIAISDCVKEKFLPIVGKNKIFRIYNGIDKDLFFCPNHKILCGASVVITIAGRITKEKGQSFCLNSLSKLLKKNRNIIIQFAGVGSKEEMDLLTTIANDNGISSQVKFLGYVKNMKEIWENTDISIVYSKFEAFGRVTIEAKMAGAVVVGYNRGGTSELIANEKDGFLFDDSNELLQIVEHIINDKEFAQKIASAGQRQACNNFTSKINCKNIIDLFELVIRGDNND